MNRLRDIALKQWLTILNLAPYPAQFHRVRLVEELEEHRLAATPLERLSEASDVIFTISRAQHEGHPVGTLPPLSLPFVLTYAYMLGKFTSRAGFYAAAAYLSEGCVFREVVNPSKDEKLAAVANRHGLDPIRFGRVAGRLRRVWPLLP